jgi:glycosyltransferase involved in cell wall biosynthesis
MPKFSVIIPTYNRENFVGRAIASVLRQDVTDYEIIVVDDGSSDGTQGVLADFGDAVTSIYQDNAGVSAARNAGILRAAGEWLAFLDSDDEWLPGYLGAQSNQIEQYPQAVVHMTNSVSVATDGRRANYFEEVGVLGEFGDRRVWWEPRPLLMVVKRHMVFLQSSVIRRDVLLQSGLLDTGLSIAEDVDLVARLALRGGFTFCRDERVEVIRRIETIDNLGAQSMKNLVDRYLSYCKVYRRLLASDNLNRAEATALSALLAQSRRALGNALVLEQRLPEARRQYWDSLLTSPSLGSLVKMVGTFLPEAASRALVRKR